MNDSDTEFFVNDKNIENIVPNSDKADISTPEASIYVVKDMKRNRKKFEKQAWISPISVDI